MWSAVVSNSQATSRNRYVAAKDAKSRPCEDWLFAANRAMCVVSGEEPATCGLVARSKWTSGLPRVSD